MSGSLFDSAALEPLIASGYTLLTPNFRLARHIRTQWDSRCVAGGRRVWPTLAVEPLEHWLLGQWQRAVGLGLLPPRLPLNRAQSVALWQQVIAQQEQASGDYHLLRPAAAAQQAAQARDLLLRYQVDSARTSVQQLFRLDLDCHTWWRWLNGFEQRLAAAGQCTQMDCVRQLCDSAAALPRSPVALVECEDIPPLFTAALDALGEDVRSVRAQGGPAQRLAYRFADQRSELQAVARWAAAHSRSNPAAAIGVVLDDMGAQRAALEYYLRREFGCLGDNYTSLPVNFSAGIALDRAPVVRDALAALSVVTGSVAVPAVVALLRSRFLDLPDAGSALAARFVRRLFEARQEYIDSADLRHAACNVALDERRGPPENRGLSLGRHLLAIAGMRQLRRPVVPSQWVQRFELVLQQWGWPGPGTLDSLEYQQVELWYRTLDEFRAYDAVCGALSFEDALHLLRQTCSNQMSQPQTPPSTVQVLGPLEATGLAFDHLWLCGMQAGQWPPPPRPNPFIPAALQRRLQMPHASAEREWAFSENLLAQYARATGVLHASYCAEIDGSPELPSPLLQDFSPAELPPPSAVHPQWLRQWHEACIEALPDAVAPPPDAAELRAIGGGSALLEDQSHCPFRAFARRRLGVQALPAFGLGPSAAERGALLHEALFVLWGAIGDHRTLAGLDDAAQQRTEQRAVQAAIDALPDGHRRRLGRTCWQLEQQRLDTLLSEWLAVERQRGEFAVCGREQEFDLCLGPLQIHLRVDRIDTLPDGSQVIIDYKSGQASVQDWLGERPAKPQLLLYGIGAPGSTTALAFAQVRARDSRFVGLGSQAAAPGIQTDIAKVVKQRMDAADWESLNACWAKNLERLALEFVNGWAQVAPLSAASCTWCALQPLCRIDIDTPHRPEAGTVS